MKETRKLKEQTVILIAWRHDEIAFIRQYLLPQPSC